MLVITRVAWIKHVVLVVFGFIGLHSLLGVSHESYTSGASDSLHELASNWRSRLSFTTPPPEPRRANATLIMLARNKELEDVVSSMKQMEDRFNRKYNYPWVFLNDEPFSEEFINRTSMLTNANASYGLIPQEHWIQPEWIDENRAKAGRREMMRHRVLYGASVPYRNMCRFNSGFFYHHELLKDFQYYWRVEPDVRFYCDLDYDPLLMMQDERKVYGFTMALYEFEKTIPSLWNTVKDFTNQYPQHVHPDNALGFLSDDGGETYNRCHFWSNFEIADMDFWRGEAYSQFFEHLDQAGGFYYERWGDAPVHSIAAGLFVPKDKLHFFSDIGYKHSIFQHCPQGEEHIRGKCWCNDKDNFDYAEYSCIRNFDALFPKNTTTAEETQSTEVVADADAEIQH